VAVVGKASGSAVVAVVAAEMGLVLALAVEMAIL
jgi:hypothetical protein